MKKRFKFGSLTDDELFSRLKHQAAQWFTNENILLLEELFRRYQKAQANEKAHSQS